jgi:hypothetical protein
MVVLFTQQPELFFETIAVCALHQMQGDQQAVTPWQFKNRKLIYGAPGRRTAD